MIMKTDAARSSELYQPLASIGRRFGSVCSPREFYWAVNDAYHTAEAAQYDELHSDMFMSLEPVWRRALGHVPQSQKLRVLDVGAGTGLVGILLDRLVPNQIASLTLLDPCAAMLERSRQRAAQWRFRVDCVQGSIEAALEMEPFDVITVNSVLHHIVELEAFCGGVDRLLVHGGVLLTAQDPRSDAPGDPVLAERRVAAAARRAASWPKRCRSVIGRFGRKIFNRPHIAPLAMQCSLPLLQQGLITRPMDLNSIWAVTDFHVPDQPGSAGRGIARSDLQRWLPCFTLQDFSTYQFQGLPWSSLTQEERQQEDRWWRVRDPHGELFQSVWRKAGAS